MIDAYANHLQSGSLLPTNNHPYIGANSIRDQIEPMQFGNTNNELVQFVNYKFISQ